MGDLELTWQYPLSEFVGAIAWIDFAFHYGLNGTSYDYVALILLSHAHHQLLTSYLPVYILNLRSNFKFRK